ncbi:MAG: hypothetical protein ACJ788_11210, partial [Ktedonobacteraceae bacterium]
MMFGCVEAALRAASTQPNISLKNLIPLANPISIPVPLRKMGSVHAQRKSSPTVSKFEITHETFVTFQ